MPTNIYFLQFFNAHKNCAKTLRVKTWMLIFKCAKIMEKAKAKFEIVCTTQRLIT